MSKDNNKWTGPDEINGVLHVGKGYRQAGMNMADRMRTDREQWYPGDSEKGESGIWGDVRPGSFDPSKIYRVPVERKDEPGIHGDSRVEALEPKPPVGEFEDGGREGGPDCQTGKCDAVEPDSTNGSEDMVNRPPHYTQGGIECIDAIRSALTPEEFRGFCKGNAMKYIWRERHKGGDEDLHKGGWYLVAATGKPTAAEGKLLEVIRELHDFAEPTRISEYADRARQAFRDAAILLGESGF